MSHNFRTTQQTIRNHWPERVSTWINHLNIEKMHLIIILSSKINSYDFALFEMEPWAWFPQDLETSVNFTCWYWLKYQKDETTLSSKSKASLKPSTNPNPPKPSFPQCAGIPPQFPPPPAPGNLQLAAPDPDLWCFILVLFCTPVAILPYRPRLPRATTPSNLWSAARLLLPPAFFLDS